MEIWKNIIGYENYLISNLGNVKNNKNKLLKPFNKENSYSTIVLYKDNKRKLLSIHRLIAIHFIPNPEKKPCVNHINGIKHDFRIKNLEWVTHSENENHSFKVLHKKCNGVKGIKNHNNKLKERDVLFIKNSDLSSRKLASIYGVCKSTILKIKKNISWKHI
jgi:hypothetical protein